MSNKKIFSQLILICNSIFIFSACETLMTRSEVEQKKVMQDSVSHLQRNNADLNNRFADIESDLRTMNGRIEVVENKSTTASKDKEKLKSETESVLNDHNKRINILQEEIMKLTESVSNLSAEVTALKAAAATADVPATKKDSFEQAEESFEKKEWRKAILSFQKYRDANPKSKKFAEATYKIGVSFQELEMKDEAKSFYDEVIAKFPQAPEAKKAKTRLKALKK